ncbi:MAG: N-formylglutamate deformylase [Pirellulaceae bacterium]|nr:N-formylglutamate deformylase [Pirellulaceae bacterium]
MPILISIPHHGSKIPPEIAAAMTTDGLSSRDTDWFLERLYDLPETQSASLLVAEWSRYVIDLNRPSDNQSLYPGQATTGLVPETCFDGTPIYHTNPPDAVEIERRIQTVWVPYHQQLQDELARLKREHGLAVLIEAHSIASEVPRLFPGRLPDFNIGTNHGQSCEASLQDAIVNVLANQSDFSHVINGRFVGGYITRHYGNPAEQIHSVQIELSQATYLDESTLSWNPVRTTKVQPIFRQIFSAIHDWIATR